jgi:hypothetical protein
MGETKQTKEDVKHAYEASWNAMKQYYKIQCETVKDQKSWIEFVKNADANCMTRCTTAKMTKQTKNLASEKDFLKSTCRSYCGSYLNTESNQAEGYGEGFVFGSGLGMGGAMGKPANGQTLDGTR